MTKRTPGQAAHDAFHGIDAEHDWQIPEETRQDWERAALAGHIVISGEQGAVGAETMTAGQSLDLRDLHAANIARQAEWCPDQVPDLSFRGNELGGECGEAQNVIKKLERERQGWRGSRATKDDLADELADVVICADLCAVTADIDLGAAVRRKFNATSEKQGLSVFLPLSALASPRADSDERTAGEAFERAAQIADSWRCETYPNAPANIRERTERQDKVARAIAFAIRAEIPDQDDEERCIACDKPLRAGERVLSDASGGTIHATCCGPERESYTGADGEPLGPNDPIPQGHVYEAEHPAGQSAGSGADGWLPIETAPKDGTYFDAWAVQPETGAMGVRFSDVQMRGDGSGFGIVIHRPRAHWEYLEQEGPTFPAWKLTHWRPRPAGPGTPAPDSTRTGQGEERETIAREIFITWFLADTASHDGREEEATLAWETGTDFPDAFTLAYAAADRIIAARPAAPEAQGAWSFDMEAAPRDGTVILLWREGWGEPSAAYWGLAPMAAGAGIADKRHPWVFLDSTNGVNGYSDGEHGPTAWHPMLDAPAPPASSDQGGR